MEKKLKHLELIQNVINRLSTNSFLLKGWSVVLVAALFALSAQDSNIVFALLAYIPTLIFWGLDGFFLWQERLYRALYDVVREKDEENIDFSMDMHFLKTKSNRWMSAAISKTLIAFHGALFLSILLVVILTHLSLVYQDGDWFASFNLISRASS